MAQTANPYSLNDLYRAQVRFNQRGLIGHTAQVPLLVEAGSLKPTTTDTLSNVLKQSWSGDDMRYAMMGRRAARSHVRSNRTKRTGLSYRQRQARGRAARVR